MNGVGSLAQHAELIQPPEDVASAVAARQSRVTTDRQRDLPSGALNLVGELHAGGRSADDEDAAGRQLLGTPVVARARSAGPMAPVRGSPQEPPADRSIRSPPPRKQADQTPRLVTTRKPVARSLDALHRRVGQDRCLRRGGIAFEERESVPGPT